MVPESRRSIPTRVPGSVYPPGCRVVYTPQGTSLYTHQGTPLIPTVYHPGYTLHTRCTPLMHAATQWPDSGETTRPWAPTRD